MVELPSARTLHSKVYDLEDRGRRRVVCSITPQHVPSDVSAWQRGDPVTWDDLDHGFRDKDDTRELRRGWYELVLLGTRAEPKIGYRYRSKISGGVIEVSLLTVGGNVVRRLPAARFEPAQVWFDAVVPNLDIYFQIIAGRVEIYKLLHTATAPRSFVWKIEEQLPSVIPLSTDTRGRDNVNGTAPERLGLAPHRKRWIQMLHRIGPDDLVSRPGWRVFTVTETWTGKTIAVAENGDSSLSDEVFYPVLIDQDITEVIAADADDGCQQDDTTWSNNLGGGDHIIKFSGVEFRPGYRFTTVAIPQGATIDAATLTVRVISRTGTITGTLAGNDVDTAPAWSTGAGPFQMPATTATATFNVPASGDYAVTVTSLVQEIVNRALWASGNSLALGVTVVGGAAGYAYIYDFAHATEPAPVLTVDYTAGGAAAIPKVNHLLLTGIG